MAGVPTGRGIRRSMNRAARWARDLCAITGAAVFLLLGSELVARAVYSVRHGTTDPENKVDPTPLAAPDYSPPWNRDYIGEFQGADRVRWEPYVYWRRMPYSGQYINVDAEGHRKTYNATAQAEARTRILVLGGSAVWGPWIRDDFTIPSSLSRVLERGGYRGVHVTSLAESGHVSMQGLLTLMHQLQRGDIPDIVVFYDGVNDVFSAFQNREAGIPLNEDNRRSEFNIGKQPARLVGLLVRSSRLLAAARGLVRGLARGPAPAPGSSDGPARVDDALAEAAVEAYLANLRIVRSLAADFGFECYFFWQPALFSKETRSPLESELTAKYPQELGEFFARVYTRIAALAPQVDRLYDLQDVFDGDAGTVFVDYCHVREPKNEQLAEAIAGVLARQSRALAGHN